MIAKSEKKWLKVLIRKITVSDWEQQLCNGRDGDGIFPGVEGSVSVSIGYANMAVPCLSMKTNGNDGRSRGNYLKIPHGILVSIFS
jgi:hypothetical protein